MPELSELASKSENIHSFGAERANLIIDAFEKTKAHRDYFATSIVNDTALSVIQELKQSLTRLPTRALSAPQVKLIPKQGELGTVGAKKSGGESIGPLSTTVPLENLISGILEIHALTLGELVSKVSEKGGMGDVRNSVLRMVLGNKLKLST
jgi:hypothetical protein